MGQWIKKRTRDEARAIRDALSESEASDLTVRFMQEVPPVSEVYVERHCDDAKLLRKVRRYNRERNMACCAEDLDRLGHIRHEIEQEAIQALL